MRFVIAEQDVRHALPLRCRATTRPAKASVVSSVEPRIKGRPERIIVTTGAPLCFCFGNQCGVRIDIRGSWLSPFISRRVGHFAHDCPRRRRRLLCRMHQRENHFRCFLETVLRMALKICGAAAGDFSGSVPCQPIVQLHALPAEVIHVRRRTTTRRLIFLDNGSAWFAFLSNTIDSCHTFAGDRPLDARRSRWRRSVFGSVPILSNNPILIFHA